MMTSRTGVNDDDERPATARHPAQPESESSATQIASHQLSASQAQPEPAGSANDSPAVSGLGGAQPGVDHNAPAASAKDNPDGTKMLGAGDNPDGNKTVGAGDNPDEISTLQAILRQAGLRVTPGRLAVLQTLHATPGHHSVEELRADILALYPAIDLVSIYRTLETLEEHGLAHRIVLGDKVTRWEGTAHAHHHMLCRECGAIIELACAPFEQLATQLSQLYGIQVDVRHLGLRGLCPHCASAAT